MKSQILNMIITTFSALLVDAATVIDAPLDATVEWRGKRVPACWARDLHHLDAILEKWDPLNVFSIILPDLGKYLDRSLADGSLLSNRPPLGGALNRRTPSPAFLNALWKGIFSDEGHIRSDASVECICTLRQLLYFAKKVKVECADEKKDAALDDFVVIDRSLPPPLPGTWNSSDPTWGARNGHPLSGGGYHPDPLRDPNVSVTGMPWSYFVGVCRLITSRFPVLDIWSLRPKHGPGAVSEAIRFKYDLCAWSTRLEKVFPSDWFAAHDLRSRVTDRREYPSRVLCVPKTQKGPRIIAAEPSANQYMQGAMERYLSTAIQDTLLGICINLRDQTLSREAARVGSIDGSLATIDLSSASDRISARLVDYVFQGRPELLDALWACRSMRYQMPDGTTSLANKFACMGSACTFPVQSILFSMCAIASVMWERQSAISFAEAERAASVVRVFGDDIIVPAETYYPLTSLLTECGLKVNADKSFGTGRFREACGLDAYEGVDVTPAYLSSVYVEGNPESLAGLVATADNFHKKGLWHTAWAILKTIPAKVRNLIRVGLHDVGAITAFSFSGDKPSHLTRWNDSYQRVEGAAIAVYSRQSRLGDDGNSLLLQFLQEAENRNSVSSWIDAVWPVERRVGLQGRPSLRLKRRWVPVC